MIRKIKVSSDLVWMRPCHFFPRREGVLGFSERNDEDASKPSWRKSFALRALLLLLRMRSKTKR